MVDTACYELNCALSYNNANSIDFQQNNLKQDWALHMEFVTEMVVDK